MISKPLPSFTVAALTAASLVVVFAAIRIAESIVTPFLLALFIVAVSAPGFFWLLRRKIPSGLALLLVIAFILGVGLVLSMLVGTSVDGFARNIPFYQERLQLINAQIATMLARVGLSMSAEQLNHLVDLSYVMGLVGNGFNRLLSSLADAFLILLLVAFMLLEMSSLGEKIRRISSQPEATIAHLDYFFATINSYFAIKSLVSIGTGVLIGVVLWIMGIDYPILWGLLAFLLNYVPTIGSLIAAVPAILMALIQFGFASAGWVAVLYLVTNNVVGNLIEPRLMGRSLGLSVLVVFLSLVFWGWLLGPVGMFLSVPLTMALKIALESSPETEKFALFLGDDQPSAQQTDSNTSDDRLLSSDSEQEETRHD
ncbi:MAG: AI-2E family transporter [Pseudomonadales bacterium]